jgi:hypothetical protein
MVLCYQPVRSTIHTFVIAGFLTLALAYGAEIAGRYTLQGVMEVGSELLLKPGGSFEYMLAYGAADYWAKGTWRRDGDVVVLTTTGVEGEPFRLVGSTPGSPSELRVWVKSPRGAGVQRIEVTAVTASGDVRASTRQDGAAVFPGVRAARSLKLHVPVYEVDGGPFELDPSNNEFTIEINGGAITQVRFKDERLKVSGDSLEMRFWNKDRVMIYRRSD